MSEANPKVLYEFDETRGIATLTFNRPEVFNALSVEMARDFNACVQRLVQRAGVRCVVISGAGRAFMAGGDVSGFAADLVNADKTLGAILDEMHPALLALRSMSAPVVAAVNGTAAGAGFSLVLGADYVIASSDAKLVLAYDKLGVAPDCGGTYYLARKIGRGKAFELMLCGTLMGAEEARALGIFNQVVAREDLSQAVLERAASIASGPTAAFGMFKRLIDLDLPLDEQLERERDCFIAATKTADFREAATAFVSKRSPTYRGN